MWRAGADQVRAPVRARTCGRHRARPPPRQLMVLKECPAVIPSPDPQSFTKFLISAGVFLCVAAFVGPGLALRDTGVLRISTRQLAEYTLTPGLSSCIDKGWRTT